MVNAVAQYRRALKKKLRCSSKAKKRLLTGFVQTLTAYLEENSNPSMEELSAAFGPPREMAEVLMTQISNQEYAIYRRKTLCLRILTSILIVVVVLFTLYVWFYKSVGLTSTNDLDQVPIDWSETSNTVTKDGSK